MTDLGLNLLYYWILCLVALKNVRLLLSFFINFSTFAPLKEKKIMTMSKKMVITAVCLLAMSAMMAQNITGKVVDTKGEPLPFANVMLLNRADSAFVKGAVSGEDGSFTINASCNGGIIKVSSVGYTTVFQDCVGGDLGVVRLSEDSKMLGEVVVKSYLPKTILSGEGMLTTVEGSVLEKTSNMEQLLSRIPSVSAKDGQIEVFQTILYGRDVIFHVRFK